jgi:aryl carrier-like protein
LPAGLPGELHIGGVGLARGYLNRPELTKEKFIPNPFAQESGARLYKTGDLCRFLPDGNIEYLGRMDNQVKIRGFRIELGEIESLLRQDPAISDAVVIAKGDTSGDMRLIAYLVPAQPALPAITLLRSHLKTRVPDYMVPAEFVFVDEIPLSANGKVDHRALPEPAGQGVSAREYTAAQNPVEGQLVQIWEDLLKRQPIGIHDDFFELGGHSLAAMQVVSRVRQSMRADLSLARFFASPTIAEIASAITDCALNAPGGHEKREEGVL